MFFGPVVDPPSRLTLPLTLKVWMEGPSDYDVPAAQPLEQNVLISRNDYIALYTPCLERLIWFQEPRGAKGALGLVLGPSHTILHKPEGSLVTQYKPGTGEIQRSIETYSRADLVGSSDHGVLLNAFDERVLSAFQWSGKSVWEWKYQGHCDVLPTPANYVVVENGTNLYVLDSVSGKQLWRCEAEKTGDKGPQDRSNVLTPGFPSVVALDTELMTILGDGRVFKRDLRTGELIKKGETPFRGAYQVTKDSIFILNQSTCEFTEYNHELMEEVNREDLKNEMRQLFGGRPPRINALLVSEDSIFWTTMYGTLMGLERHAKRSGARVGWSDFLGEVVMPISVSPKASAGYMYYSAISTKPNVRKGLVCYGSSE